MSGLQLKTGVKVKINQCIYIYICIFFFLGYCTKIVQINPVLYARAQLHTFRSLLSRRYSLPRTGPWHSCPATWCLIAILPQLIRVITLEQSVPFYIKKIRTKIHSRRFSPSNSQANNPFLPFRPSIFSSN